MEAVQHAMYDGCENNARGHNKRQAAVECVAPCEQLSAPSLKRIKWPHSREDHRCIRERIDPGHAFEVAIAEHPSRQGDADQDGGRRKASSQPLKKCPPADEWLTLGFVAQKMPSRHDLAPNKS